MAAFLTRASGAVIPKGFFMPMNYLNLLTENMKSEPFVDSTVEQRGVWISLMAWSASQETGGIIKDCRGWSERKWLTACGVTKEEVFDECQLFWFEGDDLVLKFYPAEQEEAVKSKRLAGTKGGRPKKGDAPKTLPRKEENHMVNHEENHMVNHHPNHKRNVMEGNGRERNGKERKETEPKKTPPTPQGGSVRGEKVKYPDYPEFESYLLEALPKLNPDWTPDRIKRASSLQYETFVENDWKDGYGKKVVKWKLKTRNVMLHKKPWAFGSDKAEAPKPPPKTIEGPDGWRDAYRTLFPDWGIPVQWGHVDPELKTQIMENLKNVKGDSQSPAKNL